MNRSHRQNTLLLPVLIMILVPLAYFIFVGRFGSTEVWQALAAAGCAWVLERNWWRSDRRVGSS